MACQIPKANKNGLCPSPEDPTIPLARAAVEDGDADPFRVAVVKDRRPMLHLNIARTLFFHCHHDVLNIDLRFECLEHNYW